MKNYKIDRLIKVAGTDHDRRRKLKTRQIIDIKNEYERGSSIHTLAKKYNVSYTTILYHVDDEFKMVQNQRRKYSVKSVFNKNTRDLRIAYKKTLLSSLV